MKRVFLVLMVIGLATVAFSQKTERRQVSGFTGIDASSVFDITVNKGNTESLTIEADNDVMPYVRSEVNNGVLHLSIDDANKGKNIKTLKATITMKDLTGVTLSGACKFTANDLFTPEKFKADCSGVSGMKVNVNTGQLSIGVSGSGKITLIANVKGDADWNVSGVSSVKANMKATKVTINSSGVGSIELIGSASNLQIDASGTSKITADSFVVKTATIKSSGTSSVNVNATDVLTINSSGAVSVHYIGSPTLYTTSSDIARISNN